MDPDTSLPPSNGEGAVDHFNIYRNGSLAKQIRQNAYSANDGELYYTWTADIPVTDAAITYTFWVTAVAPDGTEGFESTKVVGNAADGSATPPSPLDLTIRTYDGVSAVLAWIPEGPGTSCLYRGGELLATWISDDSGTTRLYRDGELLETLENASPKVSFTDTPSDDGTYRYHVTWTDQDDPDNIVTSEESRRAGR